MSESKLVQAPGIKEIGEVTEAILEVSLRIAEVLKDGYQPSDIAAIFEIFSKDDEIKKKISLAYEGISKVGSERKGMRAQEVLALSVLLLSFVPKFIDLFGKKGK